LAQARCGKIGDAGEDVGEPYLWIDLVETTGRDHRQHYGAALGIGEGPVSPAQYDSTQPSFGRVVAEIDPTIVKEAGKVEILWTSIMGINGEKQNSPLSPTKVVPKHHGTNAVFSIEKISLPMTWSSGITERGLFRIDDFNCKAPYGCLRYLK